MTDFPNRLSGYVYVEPGNKTRLERMGVASLTVRSTSNTYWFAPEWAAVLCQLEDAVLGVRSVGGTALMQESWLPQNWRPVFERCSADPELREAMMAAWELSGWYGAYVLVQPYVGKAA